MPAFRLNSIHVVFYHDFCVGHWFLVYLKLFHKNLVSCKKGSSISVTEINLWAFWFSIPALPLQSTLFHCWVTFLRKKVFSEEKISGLWSSSVRNLTPSRSSIPSGNEFSELHFHTVGWMSHLYGLKLSYETLHSSVYLLGNLIWGMFSFFTLICFKAGALKPWIMQTFWENWKVLGKNSTSLEGSMWGCRVKEIFSEPFYHPHIQGSIWALRKGFTETPCFSTNYIALAWCEMHLKGTMWKFNVDVFLFLRF